jgi:hypothetical protein
MVNDIAEAFGETDEQQENDQALAPVSDREQQLTQLHVTKFNVIQQARPMLKMTLSGNGIQQIVANRKAVVKMRTSVDKRRKEINAEARAWIEKVNGVAAEILAELAPAEAHLKGLEAQHERQKREAEEAERAERIALRRATWPVDAGEFPELEAGTMDAISWAGHTMVRIQNERRRLEQEREHAAERAELEEYRRRQAEIDRGFAERLANAAEYEYTEAEIAEFDHQARREEQQELVKKEWREKLETARHLKKLIGTSLPVEPVTEPVVLPVSEGVGRIADELREVWTPEPAQPPERDAATRLADLIRSLRYLVRMQGEVDWRGQITEAITDAQS